VGGVSQKDENPTGKLSADQLDLLVRGLDDLPTMPAIARRLVELAAEPPGSDRAVPDSAAERITALISSDQVLTAKLLSLVNRNRGGQVRTVAQAVKELGLDAVRTVALSIKVFETFGESARSAGGLDHPAFWKHSLAVASACEMIAEALGLPIALEEAFICGLLHDIGKLALQQALPKSHGRALRAARLHNGDLAEHERNIIGADHTVIGKRLAERWRLGEAVGEAIWLHHQPIEAIPAAISNRRLIGAVALADAIARRQRFGFSGNCAPPDAYEHLAAPLGLKAEALERIIERLGEKIQQRAEMLGLGEVTSESLYREALASANAQLGRLNEQLRSKADALAGQARAFQHLRDFTEQLTPEATVVDVLERIANELASARGIEPAPAEPVVAYSIGRDEQGTLAVRLDGGAPAWKTFSAADSPEPMNLAEMPAEEAARLVFAGAEEHDAWADLSAHTHLPLLCAGRWIGGAFLPAPRRSKLSDATSEQLCAAVAGAMALALAIVQGRCRAITLSEQLTGASQVLAATQQALAETKTLAAVGEMAAGAAHELNNPLAVISGRAQLMRSKARTAEQRKTWQLIAEQSERMSSIITEMMEFACPPEANAVQIDPEELLGRAAGAFGSSDHPQASALNVDIQVEPDTPAILADPAQIEAVILELITNAANAAEPAPQVSVKGRAGELDRTVLLTVADSGPGMDAETLARVFTPFFSAQQAGRRRGLGLAKARRYVESNGGKLWIRSQAGRGTAVYVQLPAARGGRKDKGQADV